MATSSPYFTPSSHGRRRTGSAQKSVSPAALPPSIESPRTLCPPEGDHFSYKASYLKEWYISQRLWDKLPGHFQSVLATMQHAGAAVSTGLERAELHRGDIDLAPDTDVSEEEVLVHLEDSISNLSNLPPALHTASSVASSILISPSSSGAPSPMSSGSQPNSPMSPMSLTPFDSMLIPQRKRERFFTSPLVAEPHTAKYVTELSQLRTESLVRLRHSARKVDAEWHEVKLSGTLARDDVNEIENWWAEKKCTINDLDEKVKRQSAAIGVTPNGVGWSAP